MKGTNFNNVVTEPKGVTLPKEHKGQWTAAEWESYRRDGMIVGKPMPAFWGPSDLERQQSKELAHNTHGRKFR